MHYERRPGSLAESPRGALERPKPAGAEKSLLTYDTATCVEADEEEGKEGGHKMGGKTPRWSKLGRMEARKKNKAICAVVDSSSIC